MDTLTHTILFTLSSSLRRCKRVTWWKLVRPLNYQQTPPFEHLCCTAINQRHNTNHQTSRRLRCSRVGGLPSCFPAQVQPSPPPCGAHLSSLPREDATLLTGKQAWDEGDRSWCRHTQSSSKQFPNFKFLEKLYVYVKILKYIVCGDTKIYIKKI